MTIGREEVENLTGQNVESHGKVKTNARVCGKASKVDDEAASHMNSVHFPIDKVGYTS